MTPFYQVHINKTDGTSLRKLLNTAPQHEPARLAIQRLGRAEWDSRFTFSIVRNPFDRMVSLYEYRKAQELVNGLDFNTFLYEALVRNAAPYYNRALMFKPCVYWLEDGYGNLAVDYIGRFEDYKSSVQHILQTLDLPPDLSIPHLKASTRRPYREYYSSDSRRLVETLFREDLEALDYEF